MNDAAEAGVAVAVTAVIVVALFLLFPIEAPEWMKERPAPTAPELSAPTAPEPAPLPAWIAVGPDEARGSWATEDVAVRVRRTGPKTFVLTVRDRSRSPLRCDGNDEPLFAAPGGAAFYRADCMGFDLADGGAHALGVRFERGGQRLRLTVGAIWDAELWPVDTRIHP